jgi:hypothetical protein
MGPPKKSRGATRKAASKSIADIELGIKHLDMERDRMKYQHESRLKHYDLAQYQ